MLAGANSTKGPETVRVKLCIAGEPTPFAAVNMMGNVPSIVGVPLSVPVPLGFATNITPEGRVPLSLMTGVGKPELVTVKEAEASRTKVALFVLVMAGA